MESIKMQQNNSTHKHGIGGAPTNYRRRRADHQNPPAAASTN